MSNYLLFITLCLIAPDVFAEQKYFKLEIQTDCRQACSPDQTGFLVTISALSGAKLSGQGPVTITLAPSSRNNFEKIEYHKADAIQSSENHFQWLLKSKMGTHSEPVLEGEILFYLCTEKWCKKIKELFKSHS